MDFNFTEAQKMLNKALTINYNLKHPEKITYIDKIILWSKIEIGDNFKVKDTKNGISVYNSESNEKMFFFKNPAIDMD